MADQSVFERLIDKTLPVEDRLQEIRAAGTPDATPQQRSGLKVVVSDTREALELARAALDALLAAGDWRGAMGARRDLRREAIARATERPWLTPQLEARLARELEIATRPDDPLYSYVIVNAGAKYGPDPRVIAVLLEKSGDASPGIRTAALHSLAIVGQIGAVITALEDGDESVRAFAAGILGTLGFGEHAETTALQRAMNDPDEADQVRQAARTSLRKLGALKRGRSSKPKGPPPGPATRWAAVLGEVGAKRIADPDYSAGLEDDVVASGWLGHPPATAADLEEAQHRLGLSLPPSYREFLLTTNGFEGLPATLWPVQQIGLMSDLDPQIVDDWSDPAFDVPDSEYFVYGSVQDPARFRGAYLPDLMMVGPYEEFGCYLLNPRIVFDGGEWEAWNLNHAFPGAIRYRSFLDLILAEARQI